MTVDDDKERMRERSSREDAGLDRLADAAGAPVDAGGDVWSGGRTCTVVSGHLDWPG